MTVSTQTDWVGDADHSPYRAALDMNSQLEKIIAQEFPEFTENSGAYIQTDLEEVIYGQKP